MHRNDARLVGYDGDEAQNLGVVYADDDPELRYFVKRSARDLIRDGTIGDLSTVETGEALIQRVVEESPGFFAAGLFDWYMGAVNMNGVEAVRELYGRMAAANGAYHGDGESNSCVDSVIVKPMPFKSVLYSGGPRGNAGGVDELVVQLTKTLETNPNFLGAVHKDVPAHAVLMHVANAIFPDPVAQERARQALVCLTADFYRKIDKLDLAPAFIRASIERGCRQCVCGAGTGAVAGVGVGCV